MGKLEPLFAIAAFTIFWCLFHITFLWYNFLAVRCGYYSEFWQASIPISPIASFMTGIGLFAIYFFIKFVSTYRRSSKQSVLWLVAFLFPIVGFYGLDGFNKFMLFQDGSMPISDNIELDSLSEHRRSIYDWNRENFAENRERIIRNGRYCSAHDFYQRT